MRRMFLNLYIRVARILMVTFKTFSVKPYSRLMGPGSSAISVRMPTTASSRSYREVNVTTDYALIRAPTTMQTNHFHTAPFLYAIRKALAEVWFIDHQVDRANGQGNC